MIQVFNNTGTIFLVPGTAGSYNYNPTTVAGDAVLGYYGGSSWNSGCLNITQWGTVGNEICLNANTVTITDTVNATSVLNVASNPVAPQNCVTTRGYITSTPGALLTLNRNSTNKMETYIILSILMIS